MNTAEHTNRNVNPISHAAEWSEDVVTVEVELDGHEVEIDSDDYETADFDLYIPEDAQDQATLRLDIEYRDVNNNLKQDQLELPLKLFSESEAMKYGYASAPSPVGFIIIVVLLAVIGFFAWRWYKKHKRRR